TMYPPRSKGWDETACWLIPGEGFPLQNHILVQTLFISMHIYKIGFCLFISRDKLYPTNPTIYLNCLNLKLYKYFPNTIKYAIITTVIPKTKERSISP
ncbi:MAG: hypothetical protein IJT37_03645, partial [Lachnospiraceae bacterium]|nr:hypothetical protein [Lachnospiraceae bacterium]